MNYEQRSAHLDGLRGIAAVAVALMHFFRAFDNTQLSSTRLINYTPLSAFWNGHFAVALFFVMSGLLFFRKFHRKDITDCARGAVKRYFRLSIPILVLSLIAFGLHAGGFMHSAEAGASSGSDWLVKWYRFPPDFALALREPLLSGYLGFDAMRSYNTNLWTISYELLAVIAVIAVAHLCRYLPLKMQAGAVVALALLTYGSHYFEFFLGALLALWMIWRKPNVGTAAAALIVIAALAAARSFQGAIPREISVNAIYPLAGVLLVAVAECSSIMRRSLSLPVFVFLGRLSFGVYLVHFVLLSSLAASVWLASHSVGLTFAAYVAATLSASYLFYRLVDHPWIGMLDRLFERRRPASQASAATPAPLP